MILSFVKEQLILYYDGFSTPAGVAYDEEHDRMYVANQGGMVLYL